MAFGATPFDPNAFAAAQQADLQRRHPGLFPAPGTSGGSSPVSFGQNPGASFQTGQANQLYTDPSQPGVGNYLNNFGVTDNNFRRGINAITGKQRDNLAALGDNRSFPQQARNASVPTIRSMGAGGHFSGPTAYATLQDILLSQGKSDPRAMNQLLSQVGQGTQQQQTAARGRSASLGQEGSGVAQALQAALGQAGVNAQAGIQNQEIQRAEERKRSDLGLFINMLLDPSLSILGIDQGVAVNRAQLQQRQQESMIAAITALTGGTIGVLPDLFGGGKK